MGKLVLIVAFTIFLTVLNQNVSEATKTLKFPRVANPPVPKLQVFKRGIYPTSLVELKKNSTGSPTPIQIYSPNITSTYPVLLFLHAACLENTYYKFVLDFISTHGYIVVAPQMFSCGLFVGPVSGTEEVKIAANVANWISSSLDHVLPGNAKANLGKVAIGGHGRGGKTAFAIALGHSPVTLQLNFSALIGLDPVAGSDKDNEEKPKILTYVPNSFDLTIPVTVIGTGLGNQTSGLPFFPICAPNDVNHVEFYRESKSPASHIVTTDYGHVDFLEDKLEGLMGWVNSIKCKNAEGGDKDKLRRTIAGHIIGFLNAYYSENDGDYMTILHRPVVTPVPIDIPQYNFPENVKLAQV